MSPPEGRTLVFVMGVPRSGTTWIEELIAQDPRTVSAHESHMFDEYLASIDRAWAFRSTRKSGLHKFMDRADFIAACRAMTDRFLARIAAGKPEATVIVEKTPNNLLHWRFIAALYPEAHFVVTVRDPRGVAASFRAAARGWGKRWADLGIVAIARTWAHGMRTTMEVCADHRRVVLVQYERALADPNGAVQALFAALGLPLDAATAGAYVEACRPEAMRQRHVSRGTDAAFVRTAQAESWRRELSTRRLATIETITAREMKVFGYQRATTGSAWLTLSADRAIQALRKRSDAVAAWARRKL